MLWLELVLEVDADAAEIVAGVLLSFNEYGVVIERGAGRSKRRIVRAYWLDIGQNARVKGPVEQELDQLRTVFKIPEPQYSIVEDEIWWQAWRIDLFAVRAGHHMLICPPHAVKQASPGETVIIMETGHAFGAGTHPSTSTMLGALEDARDEIQGVQALDLGCGTGILGIAALKLGVAHVLAVDIDENAVKATPLNAAANGVADRIDTQLGSLELAMQSGVTFDLVMANILGQVIMNMCDQGLASIVRPGGLAFFAGIRDDGFGQVARVDAALRRVGLIPFRQHLVDHWAMIETRREI